MKNLVVILWSVMLFTACQPNTKMHLKGTVEGVKEGKVSLFHRQDDMIVEAPIKDGKFSLEHEVLEECNIYISYEKDGSRYFGHQFIIEPGNISIDINKELEFVIKGGKYNDLLINSWRNDPKYLKSVEQYGEFQKTYDFDKASLKEQDVIVKTNVKFLDHQDMIRRNKLCSLYGDDDYRLRLLAISMNYLGPDADKSMEIVEEVAQHLGEGYLTEKLRNMKKEMDERKEFKKQFAIGQPFKNFTAITIDGNEVELAKVVKSNEYTLLELWASWCGPCRAEIPYLKKDYEKFKSKGFEIFSFSLDEKKVAWEKASKKENFPWINTCDFKGWKSPVAQLYGVTGVPYNILISREGEIVGKNLRRLGLEEKLEELLSKSKK